jgi:aminopeptidase N
LIDPWVRKIGFPVLTVAEEPGQIGIKQSRYLSTGDVKPDEDTTTWWVPLGLQGKTGTKGTTSIALTQKEDTVRDIDDTFYKINKDNAGFYRVNYPPARLAKLGSQIEQLSTMDKIGMLYCPTTQSVSTYNAQVWSVMLARWLFRGKPQRQDCWLLLKVYSRKQIFWFGRRF